MRRLVLVISIIFLPIIIIYLVVRHLNVYVGKERLLCIKVARLVVTLRNTVAMVVMGNPTQNQQFSPYHQPVRTLFLYFNVSVGDN